MKKLLDGRYLVTSQVDFEAALQDAATLYEYGEAGTVAQLTCGFPAVVRFVEFNLTNVVSCVSAINIKVARERAEKMLKELTDA